LWRPGAPDDEARVAGDTVKCVILGVALGIAVAAFLFFFFFSSTSINLLP
jgi:ABC-type cobalamin transport system permease subunit